MSKWPDKKDRGWPNDIPVSYFHEEHFDSIGGMSWAGLRAVVIGLCRRVEELEKKINPP